MRHQEGYTKYHILRGSHTTESLYNKVNSFIEKYGAICVGGVAVHGSEIYQAVLMRQSQYALFLKDMGEI